MTPRAKKSLGQHFLVDQSYCHRIVEFAGIRNDDAVLEIGPGTGQLTQALLTAGARVTAVEFDAEMVAYLQGRWPVGTTSALTVIHDDILAWDFASLAKEPIKLVANLPYNIATRVLTRVASEAPRFLSVTVMVQKEVAERILAKPGDPEYGYFSVLMEYYFTRERGFDVPSGAFRPAPKVVSHVLKLTPLVGQGGPEEPAHLEQILSAAFRQRRKTLWNNLRGSGYPVESVSVAFVKAGIPNRARPGQVGLAQYLCLARVL